VTGWIRLYRGIIDSAVFKDPHLLQLFVWLLCRASFRENSVSMTTGRGETIVSLQPGQCIVGRKTSARELGWPESSFRNRLARVKRMQIIETKEDTHWTIVSIVNWDKYQSEEDEGRTGNRTAKGQAKDNQRTQEKNAKNAKNEKNSTRCFDASDFELAEFMLAMIHQNASPKAKGNLESWANEIRLMRERDGHSLAEIRSTFLWANADNFWRYNILSPAKLRDKFGDLDARMRAAGSRFAVSATDATPPKPPKPMRSLAEVSA
jgi:hypothetical protein